MVKTEDPKASLILITTFIVSFALQVSVFFEVESPLQRYKKELKLHRVPVGFSFLTHMNTMLFKITLPKRSNSWGCVCNRNKPFSGSLN